MHFRIFVLSLCLLCCSASFMRFFGNSNARALGRFRWMGAQNIMKKPNIGPEQNTLTFTFPRVCSKNHIFSKKWNFQYVTYFYSDQMPMEIMWLRQLNRSITAKFSQKLILLMEASDQKKPPYLLLRQKEPSLTAYSIFMEKRLVFLREKNILWILQIIN